MEERTKMHKSLQTSCHQNSRLPVENGMDKQNKNLSDIDQENAADNDSEIQNIILIFVTHSKHLCGHSLR